MSSSSSENASRLSGRRPSRSNTESKQDQLARLMAMTPLERMALALSLGRRDRQLVSRGGPETTDS